MYVVVLTIFKNQKKTNREKMVFVCQKEIFQNESRQF